MSWNEKKTQMLEDKPKYKISITNTWIKKSIKKFTKTQNLES